MEIALMKDGEFVSTHFLNTPVYPETGLATFAAEDWEYGEYSMKAIPALGPIPEGKRLVSTSVIVEDGQPKYVPVYEDLVFVVQVPYMISRKQFYMELAHRQMITKQEAFDAAVLGVLPHALVVIVEGMSNADAQWEAKMQLLSANEFHRDSPWVLVVATVLQWDEDQIDDFWSKASEL